MFSPRRIALCCMTVALLLLVSSCPVINMLIGSNDDTKDVTEAMVFAGSVTISTGSERLIGISNTEILDFINTNTIALPGAELYIGTILSFADQVRRGVSAGTFPITAVYPDGTTTFSMSNAALFEGKAVYFFIARADTPMEGPDQVVASLVSTIASDGTASGMLLEGFDAGGSIFYGTGEPNVEYRFYAAIDVNGAVSGNEAEEYNDPYDFSAGFGQDNPGVGYFTYDEHGYSFSYPAEAFVQNPGIILEFNGASTFIDKTVFHALTEAGSEQHGRTLF